MKEMQKHCGMHEYETRQVLSDCWHHKRSGSYGSGRFATVQGAHKPTSLYSDVVQTEAAQKSATLNKLNGSTEITFLRLGSEQQHGESELINS
jgi:hypothetical protein